MNPADVCAMILLGAVPAAAVGLVGANCLGLLDPAKRVREGVCSACDYELAGLSRTGLCPECGVAYDADKPPPTSGFVRWDVFALSLGLLFASIAMWYVERALQDLLAAAWMKHLEPRYLCNGR